MFSILVAEDDTNLNRMICAKLRQAQYNVFSAFDGEEALNILDKEHIDLIVSDVMMPRMDGYTLTRELRGAKYILPILMITAKDSMEDMEKGFLAGTDDYMVKPLNLKEMLLRIGALLRRAQLQNEKRLTIRGTVLDYAALSVQTIGNAYYGVALTEMKERAEKSGFRVVAMGAFVAQHTMASEVGTGRPDAKDEAIMVDFGRKAYEKALAGDYDLTRSPGTNWSSSEEYNKIVAFREQSKDPYDFPLKWRAKKISDDCIKCKTCVRNCPADATDIDNKTFDFEACIGCYGCINRCPKHAISSANSEVEEFMKGFIETFKRTRLEPDIFL